MSPERNVKGAEKLRPWHLEKIIELLEQNEDYQLKDVQDFLQKEFDLHVTVSTISRQLSRAGHARARRPGYKNTRPDLQAEAQTQQPLPQPQPPQQPVAQMPHAPAFANAGQQLPFLAPADAHGSEAQAAVQNVEVKLACPFLKLNPQRYMNTPFCQNTWHSARDVKCVYVPAHIWLSLPFE